MRPGNSECKRSTAAAVDRFTDRKSTRLNSSHLVISYAVFCLKKKKLHPSVLKMRDIKRLKALLTHRKRLELAFLQWSRTITLLRYIRLPRLRVTAFFQLNLLP